ncbi:MAG: Gfo/Idh/MocA family oxidoreductase [Planctomycetes bacterium]|nr:Gfo/Idh/MocA family oxidoreductase [Planctomycetota bacterium]
MTRPTRRSFLKHAAAATAAAPWLSFGARIAGTDELKVGLIGCGGRGTGAVAQALRTDGPVRLVAMADAFADHLAGSLRDLRDDSAIASRIDVPEARCFVGFDAWQRLLASDIDVVVLATPPHFRPAMFEAAVAAGKHVFLEKPVAVDAPGVRRVLAAAELAREKRLAVVSGLQRHHQRSYLEAMTRIHRGDLGRILFARCSWNMGGLWMHPRQPQWSDMEWQLRNWLYFTWLSGDHIVEQHVHNLDVVNWALRAHPIRARGMGGRQVRTELAYGHIYDHHAVQYEYGDGAWLFSECRQIDGCHGDVSEHLYGTDGEAHLGGRAQITGKQPWVFEGQDNDPYQAEHDDLFASIRSGAPLNEGQMVAESTLTAILGRMATYTGRVVTWDEALQSDQRLGPEGYAFGPLPVDPVPMPGR